MRQSMAHHVQCRTTPCPRVVARSKRAHVAGKGGCRLRSHFGAHILFGWRNFVYGSLGKYGGMTTSGK